MSPTLTKALVALFPVAMVLFGSVALFLSTRTVPVLLQLVGAGGLTVAVLTHVCEGFQLFPWMGWGLPNSPGHYLDLGSAALGMTLFPVGYLWHSLLRSGSG